MPKNFKETLCYFLESLDALKNILLDLVHDDMKSLMKLSKISEKVDNAGEADKKRPTLRVRTFSCKKRGLKAVTVIFEHCSLKGVQLLKKIFEYF